MTREQKKAMADRIKKRRISFGFTQEQFCEAADLSISSYTKIENVFQNPTLESLIKIAQNLDLSLDYIVFGTEEREPKTLCEIDLLKSLLEYADRDKLLHTSELLIKIAEIKGK